MSLIKTEPSNDGSIDLNSILPSNGDCRFTLLPTEILYMIMEYFAQDVERQLPKVIHMHYSLNYLATWATRERRTLLALACTSRRLHAVVQPFIYRTIVLTNPGDHRHLLRALDKHPEIAKCVEQLIMVERLEIGPPFMHMPSTKPDQNAIAALPSFVVSYTQPVCVQGFNGKYKPLAQLRLPKLSSFETGEMLDKRTLSPDIANLWATIRRANAWDARKWNILQKNQRDSSLDLLELLLLLPRLKQFHYIPCLEEQYLWRQNQQPDPKIMPGRQHFLTFLSALKPTAGVQPALHESLLGLLQDLDITDIQGPCHLDALDTIMALPKLHTLRIGGTGLKAPWTSLTLPPTSIKWKSLSIRNLIFHHVGHETRDVALLVGAIAALHILHLEICNGGYASYETDRYILVMKALAKNHTSTLKELRIVHTDARWFYLHTQASKAHVDLSGFTQLAVVQLPDDVLFDYVKAPAAGSTRRLTEAETDEILAKLPPRLVDLRLNVFDDAERALGVLAHLARAGPSAGAAEVQVQVQNENDRDRPLPYLENVTMAYYARHTTYSPPAEVQGPFIDDLRAVKRDFKLRGVRFEFKLNGRVLDLDVESKEGDDAQGLLVKTEGGEDTSSDED
ncbi:hypothetical protein BDW74DRAFT_175518 [Aspergillus multicolor]|uniref:uncharacterized protein n=1 Tax=Aspergillus multicolor TaxID=41759 RepID=UPI003CCE1AF1